MAAAKKKQEIVVSTTKTIKVPCTISGTYGEFAPTGKDVLEVAVYDDVVKVTVDCETVVLLTRDVLLATLTAVGSE